MLCCVWDMLQRVGNMARNVQWWGWFGVCALNPVLLSCKHSAFTFLFAGWIGSVRSLPSKFKFSYYTFYLLLLFSSDKLNFSHFLSLRRVSFSSLSLPPIPHTSFPFSFLHTSTKSTLIAHSTRPLDQSIHFSHHAPAPTDSVSRCQPTRHKRQ